MMNIWQHPVETYANGKYRLPGIGDDLYIPKISAVNRAGGGGGGRQGEREYWKVLHALNTRMHTSHRNANQL